MTRRLLPSPIILALVLALSLAHAPEAAALPREKDRWIQVDTANFTLFSNASPATAKSVGEDLEQFRAVLSRLTTGEVNAPIPTWVYVFDGDRSFTPYKPVRDGKPADLGSLFQPRQHANYISVNGALRDQASKSVYTMHAFHFLHNNLPGLPLWFNRGLAEYYGTLEIEKKHTNIGKPDIGHVRRLREHPTINLPELFATEQHPGYRLGEPAYRFDAQCWVVVHYLLTGDPERQKQTYAFIGQLMAGVPQHAAFEKAFKTTYDGMQHELTSYIRKFTFGYLRFDLARAGGDEAQVTPMTRADVLYRLGDLLANQTDPRPEALEHFQATLKVDPRHAPALAGLGQVEERHDRHEAALEHYRQAAAVDPDDFLIQYRYADSLLQTGGKSRAAEAQEVLERSVTANPGFAPAWSKLTYAYAFDDHPSQRAITAAETAHRLLPSDKWVARNLLLLYTKAGLREPAEALVDRYFVPQATAEELADARSQLAYLTSRQLNQQYNEAIDRYNASDFAAARDLLRELLAGSPDARLTAMANELLAAIEKQLGDGGG